MASCVWWFSVPVDSSFLSRWGSSREQYKKKKTKGPPIYVCKTGIVYVQFGVNIYTGSQPENADKQLVSLKTPMISAH